MDNSDTEQLLNWFEDNRERWDPGSSLTMDPQVQEEVFMIEDYITAGKFKTKFYNLKVKERYQGHVRFWPEEVRLTQTPKSRPMLVRVLLLVLRTLTWLRTVPAPRAKSAKRKKRRSGARNRSVHLTPINRNNVSCSICAEEDEAIQ